MTTAYRRPGDALALAHNFRVFAVSSSAKRPIALIDVGCSAGLNLFVDRYRLEYRDTDHTTHAIGPASASVVIPSLLGGDATPWHERGGSALPGISARVGVDLAPLDVRRDEPECLNSQVVKPPAGRFRPTDLPRFSRSSIRTSDAQEREGRCDLPLRTATSAGPRSVPRLSMREKSRCDPPGRGASLRRRA